MKVFLLKKFVLRDFYLRLFAILTFAVGIFAAWNSRLQFEPTQTRFLVYLQPEPETILQNRNLSDYDLGSRSENCFNNFEVKVEECELSRNKARDFILKHWQEKKRAYIVAEFGGVDSFSEYHIFIEPDNKGNWHILWKQEYSDSEREFAKNISTRDMTSVKRKIATEDDHPYKIGTYYLIFLDNKGNSVAHF